MRIHFVCTGNFFRSRLAEAYLNSQQIPGFDVSSSGTESDREYINNGPISWYAMRLIQNNKLIPYMKKLPTQTTANLLKDQDKIIFMTLYHYGYAKEHFGFEGENYEAWDIPDLEDKPDWTDEMRIQATEKIFEEIKKKVDEFTAATTVGAKSHE